VLLVVLANDSKGERDQGQTDPFAHGRLLSPAGSEFSAIGSSEGSHQQTTELLTQ
jgi:hypothetical protein